MYNNQYQGQSPENQTEMGMRQRLSPSDMMLANDISKAIVGEVQAYYFYDALAKLAPNDEDQQTIKGIQEDEAKHFNWFSTYLRAMERGIPGIPAGEPPTDFKSGVKTAIHDELTANEFYLDISYRATDPYIKMIFLYASQDEQRHAALLENILINLG
jgi:rubrerythrin